MNCNKCHNHHHECTCNNETEHIQIYGTSVWTVNTQSSNCAHEPDPCIGCGETIDSSCVIYNGDNKTCLDIRKGDSLNSIINKLEALCIKVNACCSGTTPTPTCARVSAVTVI